MSTGHAHWACALGMRTAVDAATWEFSRQQLLGEAA
jgi:hypothetical protein